MKSRHPGLQAALSKLQRGQRLTAQDSRQLVRQLDHLGRQGLGPPEKPRKPEPEAPFVAIEGAPMPGHASRDGVARLIARCGRNLDTFYRSAQDFTVSSIGLGTHRGAMGREADHAYASSVHAALRGGINLIDTSLNYRLQRSERNVAAGIRQFIEATGGQRDEIVLCTKGGFLVPGAIAPGTLTPEAVVGGIHCMAPAFIADQIERSRSNLRVETIDVYYLHNPETQLDFVDRPEFMRRVHAAFEQLERAVADSLIRYYGTATWSGYWDGTLSLRAMEAVAREIAGDRHHFRFIQLPFNLGLREERAPPTDRSNLFDLATELGITVITSASLLQGQLSEDLPDEVAAGMPGLATDAQRAIQFARSTPGVTSALVGMRQREHVLENLAVARVAPLDASEYRRLLALIR